jgi:gamma-glutamyltranspeptidase/glutathione hydrolase
MMNASRWQALLSVAGSLTLVACTSTPPSLFKAAAPASAILQPEGSSGYTPKPGWSTRQFAVAAANPLATRAGYDVLKAGGSAVDAAVAVQMVLALVEPQSSGIGGGAFLVHFDGHQTQAFDGRETAPSAADGNLFLGADGKPMRFMDAVVGGRAVGVPGVLRMLAMAHRQHGKLPWATLFEPAIRMATVGFEVSPRLASLLESETDLQKDPVAAAYFFDGKGKPWTAGHVLRNLELAEVLKRIAAQGPDALMSGEIAQAIVQKVHNHPTNPGRLTLQDLKDYKPLVREPLCFDYAVPKVAKDYRICGMPPPSSGTIAIGQILGILNNTAAGSEALTGATPNAPWLHLYAESSRLAFADRSKYVGDPDFVSAPGGSWNSLLNPVYLRSRAALINPQPDSPAMKSIAPGDPGAVPVSYAPMPQQREYGTSHISIVDAQGHALAMTTTVEDAFGARQMVNRGAGLTGGFLLNNQLTDFSFVQADANGKPIANRVEAGKRPRSSMSPVLVFEKDSGNFVMSAGSPLGALIIHFTAKTLYGTLNWGLNPQQAIDLPNFAPMGGPLFLEEGRFGADVIDALKSRGHTVAQIAMPSGLQAIMKTPDGYFGGADPRREGIVMGD